MSRLGACGARCLGPPHSLRWGLQPFPGFHRSTVRQRVAYFPRLFDAVNMSGDVALASVPALVLLGMTGALALACFIKVCGVCSLARHAPQPPKTPRVRHCDARADDSPCAAVLRSDCFPPSLPRSGTCRRGVESSLVIPCPPAPIATLAMRILRWWWLARLPCCFYGDGQRANGLLRGPHGTAAMPRPRRACSTRAVRLPESSTNGLHG